jgi:hypothetical protein
VAVALAIVGGVVSAIGAIQSANAQAAAAEYNAKVQERNRLAVLAQADAEASDKIRENKRINSRIRAQYGAAGIEMAGSPLDVIEDTAIEEELDVRRIRYAGELEGIQRRDQANLYRMEAKAAKTAGMFSAVGNILGGFRQAYAGSSLMAV